LVCGFLLEINAAAYWAASALSVIGGLAGGSEHAAIRPAALRGGAAGTCFGLGAVIANAVSKGQPLAPLPSPAALLILITAIAGSGLAAAGAWLTAASAATNSAKQVDRNRAFR